MDAFDHKEQNQGKPGVPDELASGVSAGNESVTDAQSANDPASDNIEDDEAEAISRRLPRNALFMLSKLTFLQTGKVIEARVRNISSGGMLVESNVFCEAGDQIEAELRNIGAINGRVSWREGNHFGVAFYHPIDPNEVRFKSSASAGAQKPRYIRNFEGQFSNAEPSKIRRI